MDLTSLYYYLEATKDINFTKTAKRLFISQQNLSNHISKLEDYYGVQLFERKPKLKLTQAGMILREYANRSRMEEENLKSSLRHLRSDSHGELNIGCSPNRTSAMLPTLVGRFLEYYPNVKIHLYQDYSYRLWEKTLLGELDFCISVPQEDNRPNMIVTPLLEDYMVLVVKREVMERTFGADTPMVIQKFRSGAPLQEFAQLPLIVFNGSNLIPRIYKEENLTPNVVISSNYHQFFEFVNYKEYAGTIIANTNFLHLSERMKTTDVFSFPVLVKGKRVVHQIAFTRHAQKYLQPFGKFFFDLTVEYCKEFSERVSRLKEG